MQEYPIETMRHSAAHVMATAIQKLFPQAKFGVGPDIENGFYYDIDIGRPVTEEDLKQITQEMKKIIKNKTKFIKKEIDIDEAIDFFQSNNQTYKVELLKDLKEKGSTSVNEQDQGDVKKIEKVSFYQTGDFIDLCRGPHVENASQIGAFKLNKVSGAYWRGDEKNPQLQRIYGLSFATKEELNQYLQRIKEAEKRDHRKLAKDLDLYHIDEMVGLGLPLWHPKGAIIWHEIESFWYKEHLKNGYELVRTPHIGKKQLWETSGHWGFYNDSMYPPLEVGQSLEDAQEKKEVKESEQYLIKPMNCPFHVRIYKHSNHSYREFPFRWAECGTVYRYEKKGELSGLTRVRGFTQDDAHIICRADQVEEELERVVDFILFMFKAFGFNLDDVNVYLSVRDPQKSKSIGSEEGWKFTESVLEKVANNKGFKLQKDIGGAAFYGPKLDFKVKDVLGREWQTSTLQFDFNLPERFDMTFINKEGKEERPYMLHRVLFGSYERFIGLLIEHYAGDFPLWFNPIQVAILSVADRHIDEANKLAEKLKTELIRVQVDGSAESIGKKIRNAELQKIPYIIVLGDKELESDQLTIRKRGQKEQLQIKVNDFINQLVQDVKDKK